MKRQFVELSPKERALAIAKVSVTLVMTWTLFIVAYALMPVSQFSHADPLARLGIAVVLIVSVLAWQIRRIVRAELPELRAIEALGTFIPLFLLTFAFGYLSMSHNDPASFSQSLDRVRAIYFTVTTFSTTGFGDITPKLDAVRIVVSVQMLIDLALLGVILRLLSNATRRSLKAQAPS